MKQILLSQQGKYKGLYVALVDDEDFEWVNQFRWCVFRYKNISYAGRNILIKGKYTTLFLHQELMNRKWIDHNNNDGLNCQRSNMRKCTKQENNMNKRPNKNGSSQYKGVRWDESRGKWRSQVMFNGKTVNVGRFADEIEAAKAYDLKAKELFEEFAWLNFK